MSLEQLLAWIPPGSPDETLARQVNFERLPAHVAIIMDGNGRWAAQRHLPRVEGHRAGIDSVRDVVETSARLGIGVLTLYAFSVENWKRPKAEVATLMMLLKRYIRLELGTLLRNNIRFRVIGRADELAADVQDELEIGVQKTAGNSGMLFNIALNYGGRAEIVDAARRVLAAKINPDDLDEKRFSEFLYSANHRSRSPHPHQRRCASQISPADCLLEIRSPRRFARSPARSARGGRCLPEARSALRRHQPVARGRQREVTRILSGAVLIAVAVAVVWFASSAVFFSAAQILLILAFVEYGGLAAGCGLPIPMVASGIATVAASIGITSSFWIGDQIMSNAIALDAALLSAFVVLAALSLPAWQGGRDALGRAAASVFPMLYLGLPIGAMIALRSLRGREALFLLLLTVMVSDTAQYYTGRALGRRLLAPAISPKKTVEGAVGGFVCGALILAVVGVWWLPGVPVVLRALLGVAVVALGIAGDLFESMLKRSAGVKDSSTLIPGHGGVLDRIDALLFAAPVYYVFLKYTWLFRP
jgi:undecaprenyl diphosphate synthase